MAMLNLDRDSILAILLDNDIEVTGETSQDFIAFCPLHLNRDTAALNISKEGQYPFRCWNATCGRTGTLSKLVAELRNETPMAALRYIYRFSQVSSTSLRKMLERGAEEDTFDYQPADGDQLNAVRVDWNDNDSWAPLRGLLDRGFTKETLQEFDIGYSTKRRRITIPVFDEDNIFVGFSGRATEPGQQPKYWDKGLPKKFILFNLLRAQGEEVIIVEGPLDAMRVYQAGYPSVVATFGGFFSFEQCKKLTARFRSVILMTDSDDAGQALAEQIAEAVTKVGKTVYYIEYPEGIKDPGEMTDEQIAFAIDNKKTPLQKKLGGRLIGTQHSERP